MVGTRSVDALRLNLDIEGDNVMRCGIVPVEVFVVVSFMSDMSGFVLVEAPPVMNFGNGAWSSSPLAVSKKGPHPMAFDLGSLSNWRFNGVCAAVGERGDAIGWVPWDAGSLRLESVHLNPDSFDCRC